MDVTKGMIVVKRYRTTGPDPNDDDNYDWKWVHPYLWNTALSPSGFKVRNGYIRRLFQSPSPPPKQLSAKQLRQRRKKAAKREAKGAKRFAERAAEWAKTHIPGQWPPPWKTPPTDNELRPEYRRRRRNAYKRKVRAAKREAKQTAAADTRCLLADKHESSAGEPSIVAEAEVGPAATPVIDENDNMLNDQYHNYVVQPFLKSLANSRATEEDLDVIRPVLMFANPHDRALIKRWIRHLFERVIVCDTDGNRVDEEALLNGRWLVSGRDSGGQHGMSDKCDDSDGLAVGNLSTTTHNNAMAAADAESAPKTEPFDVVAMGDPFGTEWPAVEEWTTPAIGVEDNQLSDKYLEDLVLPLLWKLDNSRATEEDADVIQRAMAAANEHDFALIQRWIAKRLERAIVYDTDGKVVDKETFVNTQDSDNGGDQDGMSDKCDDSDGLAIGNLVDEDNYANDSWDATASDAWLASSLDPGWNPDGDTTGDDYNEEGFFGPELPPQSTSTPLIRVKPLPSATMTTEESTKTVVKKEDAIEGWNAYSRGIVVDNNNEVRVDKPVEVSPFDGWPDIDEWPTLTTIAVSADGNDETARTYAVHNTGSEWPAVSTEAVPKREVWPQLATTAGAALYGVPGVEVWLTFVDRNDYDKKLRRRLRRLLLRVSDGSATENDLDFAERAVRNGKHSAINTSETAAEDWETIICQLLLVFNVFCDITLN